MANKRDMESATENSGEGNRQADRAYRDAATRHARSGRDQDAARRAKEALDDDAEELEQAEAEGRDRARTTHDQRGEPS